MFDDSSFDDDDDDCAAGTASSLDTVSNGRENFRKYFKLKELLARKPDGRVFQVERVEEKGRYFVTAKTPADVAPSTRIRGNFIIHETVVDNVYRRPYFDIDGHLDKILTPAEINKRAMNFAKLSVWAFNETALTEEATLEDVLLMHSCGETHGEDGYVFKLSFHIVFPEFACTDNIGYKTMAGYIKAKLPLNEQQWVDFGVYNSNHNLRCLGETKKGRVMCHLRGISKRFDAMDGYALCERALITVGNSYGLFYEYSKVPETRVHILNPWIIARQPAGVTGFPGFENVDDELVKKRLAMLAESKAIDLSLFSLDAPKDNKIYLTHYKPYECPACQETHDHNNALLVFTKTGINFYCLKNKVSAQLLSFDTNHSECSNSSAPDANVRFERIHANLCKAIAKASDDSKWIRSCHAPVFDHLNLANLTPLTFIKAPMGAGKTQHIAAWIKSVAADAPSAGVTRVVWVSTRKAHTRSLKARFTSGRDELRSSGYKVFDYLSDNMLTVEKAAQSVVIIQAESLHRIRFTPDVLVLDEMESISDQIKGRAGYYHTLIRFISQTKTVIICDALLTRATYRMAMYYTDNQACSFYVPPSAATKPTLPVVYDEDLEETIKRIIENISKHEKVGISCNSFVVLEKSIYEPIKKACVEHGRRWVAYDGKNQRLLETLDGRTVTMQALKEEHFDRINEYMTKYDVVMYSPSMSAGTSIEVPFDHLYSIITPNRVSNVTCIQMIGRMRQVVDRSVVLTRLTIKGKQYYEPSLWKNPLDCFLRTESPDPYFGSFLKKLATQFALTLDLSSCVVIEGDSLPSHMKITKDDKAKSLDKFVGYVREHWASAKSNKDSLINDIRRDFMRYTGVEAKHIEEVVVYLRLRDKLYMTRFVLTSEKRAEKAEIDPKECKRLLRYVAPCEEEKVLADVLYEAEANKYTNIVRKNASALFELKRIEIIFGKSYETLIKKGKTVHVTENDAMVEKMRVCFAKYRVDIYKERHKAVKEVPADKLTVNYENYRTFHKFTVAHVSCKRKRTRAVGKVYTYYVYLFDPVTLLDKTVNTDSQPECTMKRLAREIQCARLSGTL